MGSSLTVQSYLRDENVNKRVEDLLKDKDRAATLMTSLITIVNSNKTLANCRPETVLNAALKAAGMNLPIDPSLGMAAIVPYGSEAQFQVMWKGFIQLAQRSREYKTISMTEVYEGQLVDEDPLRGFRFDWKAKKSDKVIGYAAYFELLNGFEKTLYMTREQVETHAKRFSKTYQRGQGIWVEDFDAMARKTVVKRLIDQFGPKSIELQEAIKYDQAVIHDTGRIYVDNMSPEDEAREKAKAAIQEAKSTEELTDVISGLDSSIQKALVEEAQIRFHELNNPEDK